MNVDGFGCLQMVLGEFRWFSEICYFSSYDEIRCFILKRSRQLWEVFVVSSNNDAKVPLKQMTKFWGNSKYKVSLKKTWVVKRSFFLWKLTYIALCKFSQIWLRFSLFWGNFFKNLLIWLIIGWHVCILGWVYDKYSYLLKPCSNFIFQVSIIFGNFLKVIAFALKTSGKNQTLIYPRIMNILSCKESKFWNFLHR